MLGLSIGITDIAVLSSRFNPATLFASGSTAGAFYDPSDLSSMYQDSAGTTAAVVNSPVGLLLDKRLGGVSALGSERITNGTFDTGLSGWTGGAGIWTAPSGAAVATGGNGELLTQAGILVSGRTYRLQFTLPVAVSGGYMQCFLGSAASGGVTAAGTYTYHFAATGTDFHVQPFGDVVIDNISVREIPGNHALQATAAARPILRQDSNGKYYLDFDGVDDFLRATFTIAQPWDRVSALRQISWTGSDRIYDGGTATAGLVQQFTATPNIRLFSGAGTVATGALAIGANGVLTERHHGANGRVAVNNGAYVTGDTGTTAPGGITISADTAGTAAGNIRLYGTCMIGRALTDAETTQLRNYFAQRAAVTL